MKQIRLFIAEKIIYWGWQLMPKGEEKTQLAELFIEYAILQAHKLKKEIDAKPSRD